MEEIRSVLRGFQNISNQIKEFRSVLGGRHQIADVIRQGAQIPRCAAEILALLKRVYSTCEAVVQEPLPVPPGVTGELPENFPEAEEYPEGLDEDSDPWQSGSDWQSETLDSDSADGYPTSLLLALKRDCAEACAMMNLLATDTNQAQSTPSLYDLLAGCCFQRALLSVASGPSDDLSSRLVSGSAASAAGAVCISTTLISDLHNQLFEMCMREACRQSVSGWEVAICPAQQVLEILKSAFAKRPSSDDQDPQIAGLKAIASGCGAIQARIEGVDAVVISFTVPKEASVFQEMIIQQLQKTLDTNRDALTALGCDAQSRVRTLEASNEGDLEIGIVITIPVRDESSSVLQLTRDVATTQAAVARAKQNELDMGFVSVRTRAAGSVAPVELRMPKFLFSDAELEPGELNRARSQALNAVSIGFELTGVLRDISLLILDRMILHDSESGRLSRVVHRLLIQTVKDTLKSQGLMGTSAYLPRYVESFLNEPRSGIRYEPTEPLYITMSCSTASLQNNALACALNDISCLVNIAGLSVDAVAGLHEHPTDEHTISYLEQLKLLLEYHGEALEDHASLNISLVPTVYEENYERYVHFYLYDGNGGLCGVGTLSAFQSNDSLRVFPPQVAARFSQLIEIISQVPQTPMFSTAPWPYRVYDELVQKKMELGFLDINDLYQSRLGSIGPLTAAQFADDLYWRIAVNPEAYIILNEPDRFVVIRRSEKNDWPVARSERDGTPPS